MRKKNKRKTEFDQFNNCYRSFEEWDTAWKGIQQQNKPVILELGCGKGYFSVNMAELYPDSLVVAMDVKRDRMWYGSSRAQKRNVNNVYFLHQDITLLERLFAPQSISKIWITFPDPYPKNAHANRRLTGAFFLDLYKKILIPEGEIHFKTDNANLFQFTLTLLNYRQAKILQITQDLHDTSSMLPESYFKTSYEERFIADGLLIHYIAFRL